MGQRKPKQGPPAGVFPEVDRGTDLTIAIAAGGDFKDHMAISLVMAVKTLMCPIRLDMEKSCYVHKNRNNLLERALEAGSSHLMFIDTDIQFPADGIRRLIAQDRDVIGGAYNLRQPPNEHGRMVSTVKALDAVDGAPLDRSAPFKCKAVPTGFMLIRLDMLRGLRPPERDGGKNNRSADMGARLWFDFGNYDGFVGEDVYFCDYVREQGVDIWCDPTIPLGHIGEHIY